MNDYVKISLDAYNKLLLDNHNNKKKLKSSVDEETHDTVVEALCKILSVEEDWNGKPTLRVRVDHLIDYIDGLLQASEFGDRYKINDTTLKGYSEFYGAFERIETDDEEDQA